MIGDKVDEKSARDVQAPTSSASVCFWIEKNVNSVMGEKSLVKIRTDIVRHWTYKSLVGLYIVQPFDILDRLCVSSFTAVDQERTV